MLIPGAERFLVILMYLAFLIQLVVQFIWKDVNKLFLKLYAYRLKFLEFLLKNW